MIPRLLLAKLKENLQHHRLVLLSGPRRAGKKTLVNTAMQELNIASVQFDVSNKKTRKQFSESGLNDLRELFQGHSMVVIHEAQYLEKLQDLIEYVLSDDLPITLILCCSYKPIMDEDLLEAVRLQGLEIQLFPPTFYELAQHFSLPEEEKMLERRLITGNYPEVVSNPEEAENKLIEILDEAIFTHLGAVDRINKQDRLLRMLQVIAFGIGEPLSYNEIGERSGIDNETVERYVDLLELTGILIRIPCWYNGHRYELKKSHVIYFYDNGIRNALIRNFNPITLRNDLDELWKNWLIAERIKWNRLNNKQVTYCFWRTHTKQSIDFIEFAENGIRAHKMKWDKKKVKFPAQFVQTYPEVSTHVLNRSTYWSFLTKK